MIRKNKILFVTHSSLQSGGAEQDFDVILEHFASAKDKYEIVSLFPDGARAEKYKQISDSWAVYRHCFLPISRRPVKEYIQFLLSYFEQRKTLKKIIGNSKVDSCFINVSVLVWFVILLGKYTDNIVLLFREKIEPGFLRRFLFKVYNKRVKTVLFVSESLMNEFMTVTGRKDHVGVFRSKMRLENREKVSEEYEMKICGNVYDYNNKLKIICSGTINSVKNQILILRALVVLKERNESIPFVTFAGDIRIDPEYKKFLDRYINKNVLSEHVNFTGHLSKGDYESLIHSCDVLILSSITEGLPIVILEALAMGKTIISTSVGSIGDIIKNGYNGLLINDNETELADSILKLSRNPVLRKELSHNGLETYQEYEKKQNLSMNMLESCLSLSESRERSEISPNE